MLEKLHTFKYLSRILSLDDREYPAVARNLQRERSKWGLFSLILFQERADTRSSGGFYVEVVQYVLLFGL